MKKTFKTIEKIYLLALFITFLYKGSYYLLTPEDVSCNEIKTIGLLFLIFSCLYLFRFLLELKLGNDEKRQANRSH